MSLWKSIALQQIRQGGRNPDTREFENVRGASTPMQLWCELRFLFESWHSAPPDRPAIEAIYEYAKWCITDAPRGLGDAGSDPFTAAWVCFYEDIAAMPKVRPLIGDFMELSEVVKLQDAFVYHIGQDGFNDLLKEIREFQQRNVEPRIPPHRRIPPVK